MTFEEFKNKVADTKAIVDDYMENHKKPAIHDRDVPADYINDYAFKAGQKLILDNISDWLAGIGIDAPPPADG